MKSVAAILGSISAVHAGADRKLAAPSGTHYAQSGMKDISTGEDMTNVQWANYDLDDGSGVTPAPHTNFGAYNCRGYFQSPIDVPKKAMLREYNFSGSMKATTSGNEGNYAVATTDSVYDNYVFDTVNQKNKFQRDVDGTKNKKYVGLLSATAGDDNTRNFGLKVAMGTATVGCTGTACNLSKTQPMGIYRPLQFHWHFPSEHTVDGYAYPGELHIVHTRLVTFGGTATNAGVFYGGTRDAHTGVDACSLDPATDDSTAACNAFTPEHMPFLVLGFFLTDKPIAMHGDHGSNYRDQYPVGAKYHADGTTTVGGDATATKAINAMDKTSADNMEGAYDPADLSNFVTSNVAASSGDYSRGLADKSFKYKETFGAAMQGRYYRYQGGLTTPPCTEGVEWVLFERPLFVKPAFFALSFGSADLDNTAPGVAAPYTEQGPQPIADLSKLTPVWSRNNRPTIPIHGRNVAFTQLTAFVNPAEPKFDGVAANANSNGMGQSASFNYLKPENMWDKKNCWTNKCVADTDETDNCKKDATTMAVVYENTDGTEAAAGDGKTIAMVNCENQCENQQGAVGQYKGRQGPINIAGAEVYKGVTPVNHAWLAANTAGYVDSSMGSAQRWKLMNTGHGFNVVPQLSVAGGDASIKETADMSSNGVAIGTKPHTLHGGHHRNLAAYGAVAGKGYYVKKINAAADAIEWFPLAQFHFHFPSENTVDGYQYDGEMHMVHVGDGSHVEALQKNVTAGGGPKSRVLQTKDAEGKDAVVFDVSDVSPRQLAAASSSMKKTVKVKGSSATNHYGQAWINAVVLGFFLKVDDAHFMKLANGQDPKKGNPTMEADMEKDSLMSAFGFKTDNGVPYTRGHYWTVDVENKKLAEVLFGPTVHGKQSLDSHPQYDLSAPTSRNYFNYMGGLTTPGCNEGVQFIIFTDPLPIRSSEMQLFKQNYWANNRPTQPRGDRVVLFNDMANAEQPLVGANKMTKVNPFAPKMDASSTTIYAVSSSGGAATNALSMLVATVMAGLALMM